MSTSKFRRQWVVLGIFLLLVGLMAAIVWVRKEDLVVHARDFGLVPHDAAWVRLVIARGYWKEGDPDNARLTLGEMFPEQLGYTDLVVHGNLLLRLVRTREAQEFWTYVVDKYLDRVEPMLALCTVHFMQGHDDQTERLARRLLEMGQHVEYSHVILGGLLKDKGQHQDALVHWRKAFENPGAIHVSVGNYDLIHARTGYAESAVRIGLYDEAIAQANEILKERPRNLSALSIKGESCRQLGKLEEAIQNFQLAHQYNPNDGQAALHLGMALQEASRSGEAAAALKRAVQIWPNSYQARYTYSQALASLGKKEESAKQLKEAEKRRKRKVQPRERVLSSPKS